MVALSRPWAAPPVGDPGGPDANGGGQWTRRREDATSRRGEGRERWCSRGSACTGRLHTFAASKRAHGSYLQERNAGALIKGTRGWGQGEGAGGMLGSGIRHGNWNRNEPTAATTSARRNSRTGRGTKGRMRRGKSGRRRGRSRVSSGKGLLCTSAASKRLQGSNHQESIAGASTRRATKGRRQAKKWAKTMGQRRRPGLGLSGSRRQAPCATARSRCGCRAPSVGGASGRRPRGSRHERGRTCRRGDATSGAGGRARAQKGKCGRRATALAHGEQTSPGRPAVGGKEASVAP